MAPGDVVRCIDARYSEGRLVEGWYYTIETVATGVKGHPITSRVVHDGVCFELFGVGGHPLATFKRLWKSSRFVPVNRKDLEIEILAKVADKIMGGVKCESDN